MKRLPLRRRWIALVGLVVVLAVAGFAWRSDILQTLLDPHQPFQTYKPPSAPDYADPRDWAKLPANPVNWTYSDPVADVFFVHPTTYPGGRHWNGPLDDSKADRVLNWTMLPNYAGPFVRVARVFAPRYRQASLYTFLTLRDDARDARAFAYRDVKAAFDYFLAHYSGGRPFIIVGADQGGALAERLSADVAADPNLRQRLIAVYAQRAMVLADSHRDDSPIPACRSRDQAGCIMAFLPVPLGQDVRARRTLDRGLVWGPKGALEELGRREVLCVNPLTGGTGEAVAPVESNLGAANATGLEWGATPGVLPRQVSAQCMEGLLRVSEPASPNLKGGRGWIARRESPPFNLFYGDLEADAKARIAVYVKSPDYRPVSPPIGDAIVVQTAPIHRID
jgi:hypothetical protein